MSGVTTMDEVDRNAAAPMLSNPNRTCADLWKGPDSPDWAEQGHLYLYEALLECAALRQALNRATRVCEIAPSAVSDGGRAVKSRSMRISPKVFDAINGLLQVGMAPPGGTSSVTPAALSHFAARVAQANRLASHILGEVPPHADKDPRDIVELVAEAETLIAQAGVVL